MIIPIGYAIKNESMAHVRGISKFQSEWLKDMFSKSYPNAWHPPRNCKVISMAHYF